MGKDIPLGRIAGVKVGMDGDLFFIVGYLGIFLALLNLIPAAPLDGGKVLSSAIWRSTGDQSAAMTWSGAAGIVAGMAIFTYGFRSLSDPNVGQQGWFTVLIGGFVGYSAFQQIRSAP